MAGLLAACHQDGRPNLSQSPPLKLPRAIGGVNEIFSRQGRETPPSLRQGDQGAESPGSNHTPAGGSDRLWSERSEQKSHFHPPVKQSENKKMFFFTL